MDGFSGTGALGLEALSRGAAFVVFVEKDPLEVQRLRKRLAAWQETSCALVVASDFFIYPGPEHPIDIVFLDPPYRKDMFRRLLKHLSRALWTTSKTRVVLELARDEKVTLPPEWILLKERVVGPSHLLILQKKQEE
jgi:16S rRNA (guanine966-N2)-methyltransferase